MSSPKRQPPVRGCFGEKRPPQTSRPCIVTNPTHRPQRLEKETTSETRAESRAPKRRGVPVGDPAGYKAEERRVCVRLDPCPLPIVMVSVRMFAARIPIAIVLVAGFSQLAMGRITKAGCYANNCLQEFNNATGGRNFCFIPDQMPQGGLEDEVCSDSKLDGLVSIHAQGVQRGEVPNIAYWNLLDKSVLGGVDWSVHDWQPGLDADVIILCLTGSRSDGKSTTLCYRAKDDDDFVVKDDDCTARSACGAMHGTTQPMLQNGCSARKAFNPLTQSLRQSVKMDIGARRPNMPAVPAAPSVLSRGEAVPVAIPKLMAYVVDNSECATSPPEAAREVFKPDKPHRARR